MIDIELVDAVLDLFAALLCLFGAAMCLTAAIGLVRFPDLISRMHPAAKPQSLGLLVLALAVVLHLRTWRAALLMLLVATLQMVTVTLASHIVARTGYRAHFVESGTLVADELAPVVHRDRKAAVTGGRRMSAGSGGPDGGQTGGAAEPSGPPSSDPNQETP